MQQKVRCCSVVAKQAEQNLVEDDNMWHHAVLLAISHVT